MLILSRKKDESIVIGNNIEIQIMDIQGDQVKIGITAPKNITVHRKEIYEEIQRENKIASSDNDLDDIKKIIGENLKKE